MSDEALGRRLRCTGCRARIPDDERTYDHCRECGPEARLTLPYTPDTHPAVKHTDQMKLTDL